MNFSRVVSSGNSLPPAIYWEHVLPRYRKKIKVFVHTHFTPVLVKTLHLWMCYCENFCLSFQNHFHSCYSWIYQLPSQWNPSCWREWRGKKTTFLFILGCIRQVEFFPTQRLVWWEPPGMRISTNFRAWNNFASEKKNKTIQKALQTAGLTIQFILQISCCISLLWNPQAFAVLAKTQEKAL